MASIVVVGAGREGKGFLGEVFEAAGWAVSFIEKDPDVIRLLDQPDGYRVHLHTTSGVTTRRVTRYEVISADDRARTTSAVGACDVIALCVYPEDIREVAAQLAPALSERAVANPARKLTILVCTNKNHILDEVVQSFLAPLPAAVCEWFGAQVEVRDCIVRRSVGAESNLSLDLDAQATLTLLIQGPISADLGGVEWMEVSDNIEALKDLKLYTYNGPHAVVAYAGYLAGFTTIDEASSDPAISGRSADFLEEAVRGASREFNIDESYLREFSTLPELAEPMFDSIARVAFDPIRKLASGERLVGVAQFCVKHGIHPAAAIEGIVDALHYDDPADSSAAVLQEMIRKKGLVETLQTVSGLLPSEELTSLIVDAYASRAKPSEPAHP